VRADPPGRTDFTGGPIVSLESRKSAVLEDPGAEAADRIQGFFARYGRILLAAVGAVIVVAVGFLLTQQANTRRENEASRKLAEANQLFWQGDYTRSKDAANEVAKQFGGTPSGIDAHRIAGDNAFWKGEWKDAIASYNAYLKGNATGIVADAVRRSLAYAYESDAQPAEAVRLYDQLIGRFERESSAEFLAASARCYIAIGQKEAAVQRLERLLAEFGETSYAMAARIQLHELEAPAPIAGN
jgi:tetratricopeptide (TPR) repeat protein